MLRQQTTACDSTRHIGRQARRYGLMSTLSGGIALAVGLAAGPGQAFESSFSFIPGDLLVSSSTYVGTAATVRGRPDIAAQRYPVWCRQGD